MSPGYIPSVKVAFRRGEGSRGGKVIGHTASGNPIYASSKDGSKPGSVGPAPGPKKKKKSKFWRNAAVAGAVVGGAALVGSGVVKARQFRRLQDAARNYDAAGGAAARGKKHLWEDLNNAGDAFYGRKNKWWENLRNNVHDAHEEFKRRGGGGGANARSGYSTANKAKAAVDKMPDLKNAKTRKDAEKVYRAYAVKYHPDKMDGDSSRMADINAAMDDYRNSDWYRKMKTATIHWSKLASAMFR